MSFEISTIQSTKAEAKQQMTKQLEELVLGTLVQPVVTEFIDRISLPDNKDISVSVHGHMSAINGVTHSIRCDINANVVSRVNKPNPQPVEGVEVKVSAAHEEAQPSLATATSGGPADQEIPVADPGAGGASGSPAST